MENAKHVSIQGSISSYTERKKIMCNISCASPIGSLMYEMVCMRSNIGHVVGIVSGFMTNPSKAY